MCGRSAVLKGMQGASIARNDCGAETMMMMMEFIGTLKQ